MNFPSKKILDKLTNEFESSIQTGTYIEPQFSAFLFRRLIEIDAIIRERDAVYQAFELENKRHEETRDRLKNRRIENQAKCKHEEFTFHGDPSGGHDSFHCCNLCGKEW